jgi:hypothetical protein
MHCAELEWIAYAPILKFEPKARARKLAEEESQRRVVSLLRLSKHLPISEHSGEWLSLWQQACSLLQDRNAILHNPMMVDVFENAAGETRLGGGRLHVFRKRRPQDTPRNFDFVVRTAEKAERYAREAYRLWGELFPHLSLFD